MSIPAVHREEVTHFIPSLKQKLLRRPTYKVDNAVETQTEVSRDRPIKITSCLRVTDWVATQKIMRILISERARERERERGQEGRGCRASGLTDGTFRAPHFLMTDINLL